MRDHGFQVQGREKRGKCQKDSQYILQNHVEARQHPSRHHGKSNDKTKVIYKLQKTKTNSYFNNIGI